MVDAEASRGPVSGEVERLRQEVKRIVLARGYEHRDPPFRLSSGEMSHDYIDGKRAVASGTELRVAAECILAIARSHGVAFEAAGGLTMGADSLACAVAIVGSTDWFSVRKERKEHGKQRLVEGTRIMPGMPLLLVDDVVTLGGSILQALDVLEDLGAEVVLAVTLVDRGDTARHRLRQRGVLYDPVLTYADLGIKPVNPRPVSIES